MIALDTNVLIRLVVGDDAKQQAVAESLLRDAAHAGEPCLICDPVLCETEWVLESCYGASRADVRAVMQRLLASEGLFVFEDPEVFRRALRAHGQGRADFSDLLIGARAAARGARTTYTFDRKLARYEDFSLLG